MNSSIEIAEAIKLARKLIDRTREGRLNWDAVGGMSEAKSWATTFATTLEGSLKATVSYGQPTQMASLEQQKQLAFSLVEFDSSIGNKLSSLMDTGKDFKPDKEVLSVSVEKDPSFGYDTAEEMRLAGLLVDLYALARRSALKIDASVEKALSYLDRIAG